MSEERDQILATALDSLPDDSREVVLLFYREGRAIRQVARLLDLSEPAVKQRLSRARGRIRRDIADRFADIVTQTAPTAAFTVAVTAALPVGAPAVATASAISKAGSAAAKGLLGAALPGPLLGVAGVVLGTRHAMKGAQSASERRALRQTAWVAVVLVVTLSTVVAFIPHTPAWMWGWFVALIGGLAVIYRVWVPRILAPRHAAERASDPGAARRQRREDIASWLGLLAGIAGGGIAIAYALSQQ